MVRLGVHAPDEEIRASLPVQHAVRRAAAGGEYYVFLSNPGPRSVTLLIDLGAFGNAWFVEELELGQVVESWSDPDARISLRMAPYDIAILRCS